MGAWLDTNHAARSCFAGSTYWQRSTVAIAATSRLRHPPPRFATGSLILSRVSSLMFIGDCLGRTRPRVQIAKAAIARDHVRDAFFHCTVLAVPVDVSLEIYYCAPGGITISSAGRSPNHVTATAAARPIVSFARVFATTNPPWFCISSLKEHHNGKLNPDLCGAML